MIILLLFLPFAASQLITQTNSIEYIQLTIEESMIPTNGDLVIQLSSKSESVPLLMLVKKDYNPTFYFDNDKGDYVWNTTYVDFEAWSQNWPTSYIILAGSSLAVGYTYHIGVYSEVIGVSYTLSTFSKEIDKCVPTCTPGSVCKGGMCDCSGGYYSGYECGVIFTKVQVNDTGKDFYIKKDSWEFFYIDIANGNDFTVEITKKAGDMKFFFTYFTYDQILPSMFSADTEICVGPADAKAVYDFSNNIGSTWTFSVFCGKEADCEYSIKVSYCSSWDQFYIWLTVAAVATSSFICCLIPIIIETLVKLRSVHIAQPESQRVDEPLNSEEINKLFPSKAWSSFERGKESCSICLEEFEIHSSVRMLGCEHFFHASCIDGWAKTKSICPLCKKSLISIENIQRAKGKYYSGQLPKSNLRFVELVESSENGTEQENHAALP
ncbi:unnamed protein product [Blepharisma stoltei]|uniref:RING-type domain-containing protein n=1 Tax=Blepharisma stoltei TaxID=1481888 RepID=A0AAU9JC75_9CILI|nr:unnamed protein product [Blepharisma stoltei]